MLLWESAYYSMQEDVVLHLAGLPAAPMPSRFPGIWAPFGTAVPPALGNVSTAQLHQLLPRAKAQLWCWGFLLGEPMNIKITAQKKEKFQAIEQGENKVSAFLCLLCLNFSLKSSALLFQVFLQLYWKSRAVDS